MINIKNKVCISVLSLAALVCSIIALADFFLLRAVSVESSESVGLVVTMFVLSILVTGLCCVFDWNRVVSLAASALSIISLCALFRGRISYLAFFFSGNILGTGLSWYLLLAAIFATAAVVCNLVKACLRPTHSLFKENER